MDFSAARAAALDLVMELLDVITKLSVFLICKVPTARDSLIKIFMALNQGDLLSLLVYVKMATKQTEPNVKNGAKKEDVAQAILDVIKGACGKKIVDMTKRPFEPLGREADQKLEKPRAAYVEVIRAIFQLEASLANKTENDDMRVDFQEDAGPTLEDSPGQKTDTQVDFQEHARLTLEKKTLDALAILAPTAPRDKTAAIDVIVRASFGVAISKTHRVLISVVAQHATKEEFSAMLVCYVTLRNLVSLYELISGERLGPRVRKMEAAGAIWDAAKSYDAKKDVSPPEGNALNDIQIKNAVWYLLWAMKPKVARVVLESLTIPTLKHFTQGKSKEEFKPEIVEALLARTQNPYGKAAARAQIRSTLAKLVPRV